MKRTSLLFDKPLAANLKYWSDKTGKTQAEIVREALSKYLKEECGLEPDRIPIVEIQARYES